MLIKDDGVLEQKIMELYKNTDNIELNLILFLFIIKDYYIIFLKITKLKLKSKK